MWVKVFINSALFGHVFPPPGRSRQGSRLAGFVLMGAVFCLMTGCLSPRYKHTSSKTPPAVMLNVRFPPSPLETNLNTLIIPGGPGSWKKEAFWDEYVVTFHNSGDHPFQIAAVELVALPVLPDRPVMIPGSWSGKARASRSDTRTPE